MLVGLGLDVIEVDRIKRVLKAFKSRFRERVFAPSEITYCQAQSRPSLAYAARWAAKEACLKALGTGWTTGIAFTEIVVVNLPSGAPTLELQGKALSAWEALGSPHILISLTHTRRTAAAVVILESR